MKTPQFHARSLRILFAIISVVLVFAAYVLKQSQRTALSGHGLLEELASLEVSGGIAGFCDTLYIFKSTGVDQSVRYLASSVNTCTNESSVQDLSEEDRDLILHFVEMYAPFESEEETDHGVPDGQLTKLSLKGRGQVESTEADRQELEKLLFQYIIENKLEK